MGSTYFLLLLKKITLLLLVLIAKAAGKYKQTRLQNNIC